MRLTDKEFLAHPMRINFAGLKGHTHDLVREGWELSLQRLPHMEGYRIYGNHRSLELQLMSQIFWAHHMDFVVKMEFPILIQTCASHIMLAIQGATEQFKRENFVPDWDGVAHIDKSIFNTAAYPSSPGFNSLHIQRGALEHFVHFRSREDNNDIYIDEKEIWTIEKHLSEIIKIQEPLQKEIRGRMLNDEYRRKDSQKKVAGLYMVS